MPSMDLESYRTRIETYLRTRLSEISSQALYEPISNLLAGGKRVRSVVMLLACEAAGGHSDAALPASIGVEFLHAASLIHDDIMDHASLRRGRPTIHEVHGMNTAILCGDYLVALAYDEMFRCPVNCRQSILSLTNRTYRALCEGQALEEDLSAGALPAAEKLLEIIEKKTASLMELATCAGALAAGVSERNLDPYARFGRMLGISFQIQDDILDFNGIQAETGKDACLDMKNNKWTYGRVMGGEEGASAVQGEALLDKVTAQSQNYMDQAIAALKEIPSSEVRDLLCRFALSLVDRRK